MCVKCSEMITFREELFVCESIQAKYISLQILHLNDVKIFREIIKIKSLIYKD